MIRLFFFLLIIVYSYTSASQRPGSSPDTSVYTIYGEQISSLLSFRGLSGVEINDFMKIYEKNNVTSDENFATLLGKLYSSKKRIAILFYFFHNDTLKRLFLEPGKIIENKDIAITKEKLIQLNVDFNYVLGLYDLSEKRMPVKRGLVPEKPVATRGLSYEGLIKEVTTLLIPEQFDSSYKHLLIIPAMNIGTIPFHLLKPFHNSDVLIDHCSFTIVPGIIDLIALRVNALKSISKWQGDISQPFDENYKFQNIDSARFTLEHPLSVSNPVYPTNTEFFFPDLPGAKKEIENAIPFAKTYTLLEGKQATKENVLKYLGESDVAYFATHGVADAEQPMEKSFIALSGNDGMLTAKNIMDVRKSYHQFPEMVILSACQTGLGKSMEAGVAGLARSFLLAGSKHIIMSLWNVDDEATAYLMNRFLFHLQQTSVFVPAEPLRQAMLDTRTKFPKPSQWASFSLFGIDY